MKNTLPDNATEGDKARPAPLWVYACILLTALLCLWSISYRFRVEARNKAIGLTAEIDVLETLAQTQGVSLDAALGQLKAQGMSSIVLSEETIGDLQIQGKISVEAGKIRVTDPRDPDSGLFLKQVIQGLQLRYPGATSVAANPDQGTSTIDISQINPGVLRSTPIGLNPREVAAAKQAGLDIIARYSNPAGATDAYIRGTLKLAHEQGATVFLPMGDQVLGRREGIKTTIDTLKELGMDYATPEFAKIGGDDAVVKAAKERVIRLHSAQTAELDRLSMDDAVDRYSLAGIERNMRLLLLRPVSLSSSQPLSDFVDFVKAVNDEIRHRGGQIGKPRPFEDPSVPAWLVVLIAASIVPTAYWVGSVLVANPLWRKIGLTLLVLLAIASSTRHGVQLMALVATLVFPIAAFLLLDRRRILNPMLDTVITTAISMVGGMCVAGMLVGLAYMVKAEVFTGIKLAIFLPVVIVGAYYFHRLNDTKAALKSPITWGASALAFLMLALLAFMIARTGNDNPAGVSGLELQMRQLLHDYLPVRPRTKEFLIGHPLLVVGIGMLAMIKRRENSDPALGGWTALALMTGAIGQTGVVNTFCHLHTPIDLSFLRVGVGLLIGCIIGGVLWAIAKRLLPATNT